MGDCQIAMLFGEIEAHLGRTRRAQLTRAPMKMAATGDPFCMFLEMHSFSGNQLLSLDHAFLEDFIVIARWATDLIHGPHSRRGRSRSSGTLHHTAPQFGGVPRALRLTPIIN